jgi:hypothetical protein
MWHLIAGDGQRGLDGNGGKVKSMWIRWLTRTRPLTCPRCHSNLIEPNDVRQAARRLPRFPFWRSDTRRIMVRCENCRRFHLVFTYLIFNWIPPARLTAAIALLNVLIAALVLYAALPHYSLFSLLSL